MGKVYASSDWHGCAEPALAALKFLQPDDKLYYLGDACDRGSDGVMLLKKLLSDPRVTYIKGNHDFFIEACAPYFLKQLPEKEVPLLMNWYQNGGLDTIDDLSKLSIEEFRLIYQAVLKMPVSIIYESPKGHEVILEHAGYTPENCAYRSHDPLWDRSHFNDNWSESEEYSNTYIVHGHTPVQYLKYEYGYKDQPPKTIEDMEHRYDWWIEESNAPKPEVIRYCDTHKYDIDMCTIASGRVVLLDLDTFETIYFDKENNND